MHYSATHRSESNAKNVFLNSVGVRNFWFWRLISERWEVSIRKSDTHNVEFWGMGRRIRLNFVVFRIRLSFGY